jgi:hypothetical protein
MHKVLLHVHWLVFFSSQWEATGGNMLIMGHPHIKGKYQRPISLCHAPFLITLLLAQDII